MRRCKSNHSVRLANPTVVTTRALQSPGGPLQAPVRRRQGRYQSGVLPRRRRRAVPAACHSKLGPQQSWPRGERNCRMHWKRGSRLLRQRRQAVQPHPAPAHLREPRAPLFSRLSILPPCQPRQHIAHVWQDFDHVCVCCQATAEL